MSHLDSSFIWLPHASVATCLFVQTSISTNIQKHASVHAYIFSTYIRNCLHENTVVNDTLVHRALRAYTYMHTHDKQTFIHTSFVHSVRSTYIHTYRWSHGRTLVLAGGSTRPIGSS
jgi:hypothetical protein